MSEDLQRTCNQVATDTISRQAAMDEISKQQTYKMFYGEDTMYFDANDVASVLASMPSAEQKKGKWIKATGMMPPEYHGRYCCSECGNFANMEPPFGNREDLSKFCPNCGADMRGEKNE